MRLYFFSGGSLRCDKSLVTMGRGMGQTIEMPVPFFLIQHPKGNLLYDTGMAKEIAVDSAKHWGRVANKAYKPMMDRGQYCTNQLEQIGVKAEDVRYVVMSHLHSDHAGGVMDFPNAKIFVQRDEMAWAHTCDFFQKLAYIKADFDRPLEYVLLEGWRENPYDVFGDGSVKIWFTPGHTPGHQALSITLPQSGTFLFTGDSCYTNEIVNKDILPGVVWNSAEAVNSIRKIRNLRDDYGMIVIPGHDLEAWSTYKKAPEYYE